MFVQMVYTHLNYRHIYIFHLSPYFFSNSLPISRINSKIHPKISLQNQFLHDRKTHSTFTSQTKIGDPFQKTLDLTLRPACHCRQKVTVVTSDTKEWVQVRDHTKIASAKELHYFMAAMGEKGRLGGGGGRGCGWRLFDRWGRRRDSWWIAGMKYTWRTQPGPLPRPLNELLAV